MINRLGEENAPFICQYCGSPSWIDPSDQTPPPDYCHEMTMAHKKIAPAMNLPHDSYQGIAAHQSGQPIESCPYDDKRKPNGRLSWSRSFIAAWRDGWHWSARGRA
ncbi:MAG: hypothetical protein F9K47_09720 [Burkholderiales bacterium]|nr:MAG: hypothetical protein F9K47_09720 [Burkholderiales bacterium]